MGDLEKALLEYYRNKNKENPEALTLQEVTEWLWLEYKGGLEKTEAQEDSIHNFDSLYLT